MIHSPSLCSAPLVYMVIFPCYQISLTSNYLRFMLDLGIANKFNNRLITNTETVNLCTYAAIAETERGSPLDSN